jgi:hypothetical protein
MFNLIIKSKFDYGTKLFAISDSLNLETEGTWTFEEEFIVEAIEIIAEQNCDPICYYRNKTMGYEFDEDNCFLTKEEAIEECIKRNQST